MINTMKALAAVSMLSVAVPAAASTTFNTTDSGSYTSTGPTGSNAVKFTATGGETVTVKGYQLNQNTSPQTISSAHVGVYSPGLGVTGAGDYLGLFGYHQIDNINGYTDFVLLTFNSAVTLDSIGIKSFSTGLINLNYDNDLSFQALTAPFNTSTDYSSFWQTIYGNGTQTSVSTGSSASSTQWLVGAAVNNQQLINKFNSSRGSVDDKNNDGFKISSLTVHAAVPEPATWAMMLVGFGVVGASMRRRRPSLARQAA